MTAVLASLALSASTAHAADCVGANLLPAVASIPTAQAATLCLLNEERAARGLAALTSQPTLESAATAYSQAMVQQRFFAHVTPAGGTLDQRLAAYVGSATNWTTGENLAWGGGTLATPAAIVKAWMESPAHRDNVLKATFKEIGVGIVGGSPTGLPLATSATYTTHFGARESAAPAASAARAAASGAARRPAGRAQPKRISAKQKKQISQRCRRVSRRTKVSRKTRAARYDRCMSKALRAASR